MIKHRGFSLMVFYELVYMHKLAGAYCYTLNILDIYFVKLAIMVKF